MIDLGYYKWKKKGRYAHKIGKDLLSITKAKGFVPFKNDEIKRNPKAAWSSYDNHAEVRMTAVENSEGADWHQDGDTSTDDMNFGMIVWASRQPTELKTLDGKIVNLKPYHIYYFHNQEFYHRRPNVINGRRFFFRQRVEAI